MSNDPTGNGKVTGMPQIRDGVQVVGPFSPQGLSLSESRAKIFVCQPKGEAEERPCADKIARHPRDAGVPPSRNGRGCEGADEVL